jgi:hypothetical protein
MLNLTDIFESLKEEYKNYEIIAIKKNLDNENNKPQPLLTTHRQQQQLFKKKQFELYFKELLSLEPEIVLFYNTFNNNQNTIKRKKNTIDDAINHLYFLLNTLPKNIDLEGIEEIDSILELEVDDIKKMVQTKRKIKLQDTFENISHIINIIDLISNKTNELNILYEQTSLFLQKFKDQEIQDIIKYKYMNIENEQEELIKEYKKMKNRLETKFKNIQKTTISLKDENELLEK